MKNLRKLAESFRNDADNYHKKAVIAEEKGDIFEECAKQLEKLIEDSIPVDLKADDGLPDNHLVDEDEC